MQRFLLAGLVLTLAGCSSQVYHKNEGGGNLRTELSEVPGYDYKVTIKNVADLGGFDFDRQEDRLGYAKWKLPSCKSLTVVSETMDEQGERWNGRKIRTYVMRLKCDRA